MSGADPRAAAAGYYDVAPNAPDDIAFYRERIPSSASLLELGCGTGRVLVPLAGRCAYILGLDASPAMLSVCKEKLSRARIGKEKAEAQLADITNFSMSRRFDLVIAPFRVMQALESDREISGLFECIRKHLAPNGSCILNAFRPLRDVAAMRLGWIAEQETFNWEVPFEGGRLVRHDRRRRMDAGRQVLYPELVYRKYSADDLVDEVVHPIVMRYWYPEEFVALVESHGFEVSHRWGGYQGERYGEGGELVLQFGFGAGQ